MNDLTSLILPACKRHLALAMAAMAGLALVSGCDTDDDVEVETTAAESAQDTQGYATDTGSDPAIAGENDTARQAGFVQENDIGNQPGVSGQQTVASKGELTIEKTMPETIVLGQNMTYAINVSNDSGGELGGVMVREELPAGFDFDSAEPQPESSDNGMLVFRMGSMADGASAQIRIVGTPQEVGTLEACTTYDFERGVCGEFTVANPQLHLTKTGPEGPVSVCEPVEFVYILSNEGDTAAQDVMIYDELPEGMMLTEGEGRTISHEVGTVEPGHSIEHRVRVMSERAQVLNSYAYAESNLEEVRSRRVNVEFIEPELALTVQSQRPFIYAGDTAEFAVVVTNNGTVASHGTVLAATSTEGEIARIYQSGQQGAADEAQLAAADSDGDNNIVIGMLEPGASRTVYVEMQATEDGEARLVTLARSVCERTGAELATAQGDARIDVRAAPAALQIAVVDKQDPVRVGERTTYEISVWNEGRVDDTNLRIIAALPEGMSFVSDGSGGASEIAAEGNTLTFAPIERIAAGDKVTWYVVATADSAVGNTEFTIDVTSDKAADGVQASEPTRLY